MCIVHAVQSAFRSAEDSLDELDAVTADMSVGGEYGDPLLINRLSNAIKHALTMLSAVKMNLLGGMQRPSPVPVAVLESHLKGANSDMSQAVGGLLRYAQSYRREVSKRLSQELEQASEHRREGEQLILSMTGLVIGLAAFLTWRLCASLARRTQELGDVIVGRQKEFDAAFFSTPDELSQMGFAVIDFLDDRQALADAQRKQESIANDLNRLIYTANAPIIGVDTRGRINEWNRKAAEVTGFSREELLGEPFLTRLIESERRPEMKQVLDKALSGEDVGGFECVILTAEGGTRDILLNATCRRDAAGRIVGAVGVGQDITERKAAQIQLVHSSKMATLGEMATGVAHELNQPLGVVQMAVDNCMVRLQKGTLDPEFAASKLKRIEAQVQRAAEIIDHMRVFGRKVEDRHERVDVADATRGALDLVREQFRVRGIEIEEALPGGVAVILGHRVLVEQVILNLLVNARDALDARDASHPHRVTARVGIDGAARTVGIEIGDTGGGIPSDVLPRLFEPFFTTKEAGKGTGLGLSISWGIVSDMGGQITADNTAEGALFKVTFPLADPAEASDEDETASSTREPDLADQARALLAAAAAD